MRTPAERTFPKITTEAMDALRRRIGNEGAVGQFESSGVVDGATVESGAVV